MEYGVVKDMQGNVWESFVNEFQQRQLKCVSGAREGDVIHDPRLGDGTGAGHTVSTRDPMKPARDPWLDGLNQSEFPGAWDN